MSLLNRLVSTGVLLGFAVACAQPAAPQPAAPAQPEPPAAQPTTPAQPQPATTPVTAQARKLNVVATFSVLGDLVKNVAGDRVNLTVLVGPESDPHDYEPTPQDSARLAEADLLFENGLELEAWIDRLFEASGSKARRVDLSEGIQPIPFAEHSHGHGEDEHKHGEGAHKHSAGEHKHGEGAHKHGEFDPHVWQDPQNVIKMVQNIAAALKQADSANAEAYEKNAASYIAELQTLDKEIESAVANIPAERRKLATSHEALGYFAKRYGFEIISLLGVTPMEGSQPSAQQIAEVVERLKKEKVPVVFLESVGEGSALQQIVEEAGVKVGPVLFTDGLFAPGKEGATYLEAMRYNARVIFEALK
ncbi:MAG: zinc ABC transporter substrate-binding protein [Thermoflexales bacterium]|nr:zinc ABC transporter substrate-binding protein [Thermoflexales bacterium]